MRRRNHIITSAQPSLVSKTIVSVRFSEVDSMSVVWHGNYVKYFEDGREAFGLEYPGIAYLDIYGNGFTAPVVDMHIQYLRPLTVGQTAEVEVRYIDTKSAKICFEYIIRRTSDGEVAVKGSTVQVFLDKSGELILTVPEFVENWKRRWLK